MDVYFSCPLSHDDLSGVLRTIVLFLESLKLEKTCDVFRNECRNLGFDVALSEAKPTREINKNQSSSSEKAVDSSVFETSVTSNSVNVVYSSGFKNSSENEMENSRKSAATCHPLQESVGIQYDKEHFTFKTPPPPQCNAVGICNNLAAQNGSGENEMLLDCNKIVAFDEMFKKFKTLQIEHVKLMGITAELVKALQVGINGQSERFYKLCEKCKEVYPDLFLLMQNQDELTEGVEKKNEFKGITNDVDVYYLTAEKKNSQVKLEIKRSMSDTCLEVNKVNKLEKKESSKSLDNVAFDEKSVSSSEENFEKADDNKELISNHKKDTSDFFDIDYGRLKNDLMSAGDCKKMLVLQALRWRITKQPTEVRENVMASYIKHDLLCLQAPFREKLVFLESLFCPKNPGMRNPVQDSVSRLVNTFASLSAGRDYLCQCDNLLTQLLLPLILDKHHSSTKLSHTTKDMILATLQKLSLRFHARQKMITYGLTEFLINYLNEHLAHISTYCLEYCTALMMNLCLHKEGRSRCTLKARDTIKLIKNLLSSKHAENIMPYVSGTMYSLFGNRKINAEAKLLDLATLLRHHIQTSDGDNRKQLEYILKIHLEGGSIKHPDPKMEGDELDLLEPELEEDDPVRGDICGEQVLADYKIQQQQQKNTTVVVQNDPFVNLPKTPRPKSVSTRTDNSEKLQLKCPHPSKCTSMMTDEVVKQEKVAEAETTNAQIPPVSPTESFSEVTKQFYHKPSKKKGIFDKRKCKFPKNPYQTKLANIPSDIRNPEENEPNSNNSLFVCNCGYRQCEYGHQNSNKYTCCCYEAMKAFIENTNVKAKNDCCSQTSPKHGKCETLYKKSDYAVDNKRTESSNGNLCNVKLEVQTDGTCNKACVLEEGENCCKCYNVIFQSRPRIVRTPPHYP